MSQSYPCDVSREQFNKIKPMLESVRKKTCPGSVDLYDVFCGVLYVLKSSCQWRIRSELHTFKVMPKRWVVERSFAWLEKCTRIWENCERKINTILHMVALAFIALLLKRL